MYLVMEFCDGGDLAKYIAKNKPLDEALVKTFAQQIGMCQFPFKTSRACIRLYKKTFFGTDSFMLFLCGAHNTKRDFGPALILKPLRSIGIVAPRSAQHHSSRHQAPECIASFQWRVRRYCVQGSRLWVRALS